MRIRISTIPLTSGLGARSSKLGVRRLLCETLSALAANLHRSSTARALLLRRNPGTQCVSGDGCSVQPNGAQRWTDGLASCPKANLLLRLCTNYR